MDLMSIKHRKIMKVVNEKNLEQLNEELKGIEGVATALGTDTMKGIPDDEKKIDQRRKKFGSNTYKKPRPKGFFRSVWRPLQEFAILNDFVNMLAAFILFVAAYSFGSCIPSSAHKSKAIISGDEIEVMRGGENKKVSKSEIVVGDVVCLKIGDKVPADGLFLRGNNLRLVEEENSEINDGAAQVVNEENPFLFSESQVVDGYRGCQMIVTSVGMKAKWCEMMRRHSCGSSDEEIDTVEDQVYELTCSIRKKVGLPIALLGFMALLARYFTGNTRDYEGNQEFIDGDIPGDFLDSSLLEFIGTAFTTVVVVIPESLRLGVALTIFYSKKRMKADMETVSDSSVSGCETMGSVTTICTSKTGTLTMNQMRVKEFYLSEHCVLGKEAYFLSASTHVKNLLEEGIALNTSPSSLTDKAILTWAVRDLDIDMEVKSRCTVLLHDNHDDEAALSNSQKKKRSGVLMKREVDNTVHVHWKGEAKAILEKCSSYYDISVSGNPTELDDEQKVKFLQIIQHMTERNLQCIAFAHNQVELVDGHHTLKEDGLVLLGLVGIKDPCRPKMKEAVKDCQNAGVDVKMFTSDNISSAEDIARECGILLDTDDQDGAVITGEAFRKYSQNERMERVDKIRVMANSSPDDKLLMVKTLKKKDGIVAVTGNNKNAVFELLEADVGICMGIKFGSGVTKKVSDIVILDDNFASVARLLKSSICIYNNMQKFIQFELTLNLAALAIIFISAACAGEIPLNSGDVLWLNLIVNTLASLALATERPTEEPIKRQPVGRKEPLISNIMLRNLLAQVLYQIVVVFTLMFKAKSILGVETMTANSIRKRNTLIFHAFLLCQVFNEFNARNLKKKNVFKGIHRDKLFLVFVAITISVEVMFLELFPYPNSYFERLELWLWGICFGIGFISWPIGCVVKCIPVPEKPVLCYLGLLN